MTPKPAAHTPTPWRLEVMTDIDKSGNYSRVRANKKLIGALMDTEDAAYIVRAVNAHEELLTLTRKIARMACHAQYVGKKCICFSCSANDLIVKNDL